MNPGEEAMEKARARARANQPPVEKILVTERDTSPPAGTILPTPPGKADKEVVPMPAWKQALVRAARTFLQALIGNLTALGGANAVGLDLPLDKFGGLLVVSASLAVAPTVYSLLQNFLEILRKWDTSMPELRA